MKSISIRNFLAYFLCPLLMATGIFADQKTNILDPSAKITEIAKGMKFTEGPVWLPRENKLLFSDIPNSKILQWSPKTGLAVFRQQSKKTNGNLLDNQGNLLSCRHETRDVIRTNFENGSVEILANRFQGRRFHSPNDIAIKSDGSIWFTDPPWGGNSPELQGHYVFCKKTDGGLSAVLTQLAMPNGIVFSPNESILYVSDTGGHAKVKNPKLRHAPARVHLFRVNPDHTVTPLNRYLNVNSDGMTVDVHGNIYTTTPKGVFVFDPNDQQIAKIPVPQWPSNICFGGEDFQTLYITARTSVYSLRVSVPGSQRIRR